MSGDGSRSRGPMQMSSPRPSTVGTLDIKAFVEEERKEISSKRDSATVTLQQQRFFFRPNEVSANHPAVGDVEERTP